MPPGPIATQSRTRGIAAVSFAAVRRPIGWVGNEPEEAAVRAVRVPCSARRRKGALGGRLADVRLAIIRFGWPCDTPMDKCPDTRRDNRRVRAQRAKRGRPRQACIGEACVFSAAQIRGARLRVVRDRADQLADNGKARARETQAHKRGGHNIRRGEPGATVVNQLYGIGGERRVRRERTQKAHHHSVFDLTR